ncbi:tetratricopeptide repeat protein [Bremerella sp. T1]|uniref:tetratricopeptide repeat protein n=1 Tax=Bremerella sp. TYQ1 TaxID=3119568 RepID=UPI001CCFCCBB|nr:tetratricopeptide repeat protein [Bremerella volcania]UBM35270.1 tetratricopeptide repeat protein [Bremerella volcania]
MLPPLRLLIWTFAFAILFSPFATAAEGDIEDVTSVENTLYVLAPTAIRDALQDRKYDEAIELIDAQLAKDGGDKEQLLYLKGRALHFSGKYEEAVKTFEQQLKRFPDSKWSRKANFAIGLAYARSGNYRLAEEAYREQARYLLSLDRKEEVAEIYLSLATVAFECGEETKDHKEYTKALQFYQKALEVGPKPKTKDKTNLQIARSHKHLGRQGDAINVYAALVADSTDRPTQLIARYELGDLYLQSGQHVAARKAWEDLLALHDGEASPLMAKAAFRMAETYQFPSPPSEQDLELGVAAIESYLVKYPEHESVPEAHFRLARAYSSRSRGDDAVAALQSFLKIEQYAETDAYADARFLLGSIYAQQNKFDEAIAAWSDYLSKHPTHSKWSEAQQRIINTQYQKAEYAYSEKNYDEARKLWQEFLVKYPIDSRSQQIQFRIGESLHQEEKWQEAIASWQQLASKFPGSHIAAQAKYHIALTTEQKLDQLADAMELYKELANTPFASQAHQRITQLSGEQLEVATLRKFRSNQKPSIQLKTRNLESVQVQIYPIDLETYFRKMQTTGGIESLDIALIDPAESFTFEVPKYEKYRLETHSVEIPIPALHGEDEKLAEAGVVAVTVTGEKKEATTIVLQSDLDMIVKSSRDEVFVYAQNMKTGKPWADVRLLMSNGSEVFAEAATGEDGVYRAQRDELHGSGDIRVLGVVDGHSAANVVSLSGLQMARGLQRRGYLYTDRPAYRPGQLVHVRGIIRHVKDDRYVTPAGQTYQLEVLDPRGRSLLYREVKLSDFGSAGGHLLLPAEAAVGSYQVLMRSASNKSETYQGNFTVAEFQLPRIFLEIETEEDVYYRGEVVKGTITAKYYHGDPVIKRNLQYFLDGKQIDAQTNNQGQVEFELPTRDLRDSKAIKIHARMPSENASTGKSVFISAVGFSMTASVVRDTYIHGESFDVTAMVKDLEGEPLETDLTLSVMRLSNDEPGQAQEVLVSKHELKSNENGEARQTLALEKGGQYILRFTGVDRFKHDVSAQTTVKISDENDRIRLHILADSHSLKSGQKASIDVHWRGKPTLALVTFEGSKILDYRLVELKDGKNALKFDVDTFLAPNFQLAISAMTDVPQKDIVDGKEEPLRFHTAESVFQVERDLRIELTLPENARPGDTVNAQLKTTDALGNPLPAEVSLALVEKSLLDQFPPHWTKPSDFWQGNPRVFAMRASSSIDFHYQPSTEQIDEQLLAEAERIEAAEEIRLELNDFSREQMRAFDNAADADPFGGNQAGNSSDPFGGNQSGSGGSDPFAPTPSAQYAQGDDSYGRPAGMGGFGGGGGGGFGGGGGGFGGSGGAFGRSPGNQPNASASRPQSQLAAPQMVDGLRAEKPSQLAGQRFSYDFDQSKKRDLMWGGKDTQWEDLSTLSERNWYFDSKGNANLGIQVLDANGGYSNRAIEVKDAAIAQNKSLLALVNEAEKNGDLLLPGLPPQETAFWVPSLVTNQNGIASVDITLPPNSTTWKMLGKGITVETLAGETEAELTVTKSLFADIKLPMALQSGDKIQVPVRVFKTDGKPGEVKLALEIEVGDKKVTQNKTLTFDDGSEQDILIPLEIDPESVKNTKQSVAEFRLEVQAGDMVDVQRRSVPVRQRTYRVVRSSSGQASSDMTAVVNYPEGMPWENPSLQVVIGPNVRADLLSVLDPPAMPLYRCGTIAATPIDTLTSDILTGLALEGLLKQSPDQGGPSLETVKSKVDSAIASLIVMQNDDGGFSWSGAQKGTNRYSTARALWALAAARKAGHRVDDDLIQKSVYALKNEIPKLPVGDYDSKATLLHALTVAGSGDFSLANQLHRNRQSLTASGCAYLALVFAEMSRDDTARELADLAKTKIGQAGVSGWNSSTVEAQALYALCVLATQPKSPEMTKVATQVLKARQGHRWHPDKATGPAMMAVCGWTAGKAMAADEYKLTILVNDQEVKTLNIDAKSITQTVEIPADLLKREKQETVRFQLTGRGDFTYRCELAADVPLDKLKSNTSRWYVRRYYDPAPLRFDGEEIPRGFGVVSGSYQSFRNELTQLPGGDRGTVRVNIYRSNVRNDEEEQQMEYLVVTEPIPAGTTVDPSSISGSFERYEIHPGYLLFYLGPSRSSRYLTYELVGIQPGDYYTAPTLAQDIYQPESLAVGAAKSLNVLPTGQASGDEYRLTPQELYELGRRKFDKGDIAEAESHLTELFSNWSLDNGPFRETTKMLFDIHLQADHAAEAIKFFELLIEKFPDEKIPFAKLLKVGDAYNELGEYERSYLVFRATVEANFMVESQVAGFLVDQGEAIRSIQVMEDLLKNSPQEPYAAIAEYALATDVYGNAAQAAASREGKNLKLTKVHFLKKSLQMLEQFLTTHPEDPSADEAAFTLASGMTELEQYEQTIKLSEKYTRRYPKSDHLSSFWYLTAFCHFALSQPEEALKMSDKVAESVDASQRNTNSVAAQNRWRAIYIMGQIYHSLNQAAKAIDNYSQVKDRFVDAAQAIDYFTREAISVEEVTSFLPEEDVKLKLDYRNVKACEVKVYRIDLMKFGLLQRNLQKITTINLAGIQPLHETTIELGDGKDYQDKERDIPLPLEEEGAYLIVARADNLHASGLVLISPLRLDVNEDHVSGRVRVTVKNKTKDTYVDDVHVKVIGTSNSDFVSGETDLRGIFIGDGIRGRTTVIAEAKKGEYAFFRGATDLALTPEELNRRKQREPQSRGGMGGGGMNQMDARQELLKGIQSGNGMIQQEQRRNLDRFYRNDVKGGIKNFKF